MDPGAPPLYHTFFLPSAHLQISVKSRGGRWYRTHISWLARLQSLHCLVNCTYISSIPCTLLFHFFFCFQSQKILLPSLPQDISLGKFSALISYKKTLGHFQEAGELCFLYLPIDGQHFGVQDSVTICLPHAPERFLFTSLSWWQQFHLTGSDRKSPSGNLSKQ